eukprot:scaffold30495_cov32-Tisochrysis_lutea.AAC.2
MCSRTCVVHGPWSVRPAPLFSLRPLRRAGRPSTKYNSEKGDPQTTFGQGERGQNTILKRPSWNPPPEPGPTKVVHLAPGPHPGNQRQRNEGGKERGRSEGTGALSDS